MKAVNSRSEVVYLFCSGCIQDFYRHLVPIHGDDLSIRVFDLLGSGKKDTKMRR
jgi:hypothetical protein